MFLSHGYHSGIWIGQCEFANKLTGCSYLGMNSNLVANSILTVIQPPPIFDCKIFVLITFLYNLFSHSLNLSKKNKLFEFLFPNQSHSQFEKLKPWFLLHMKGNL